MQQRYRVVSTVTATDSPDDRTARNFTNENVAVKNSLRFIAATS